MRIRDTKLQLWLSPTEADRLKKSAARAKMSRSAFIRSLINGYLPKEQPPIEHYEVIRQLRAIGNNMNQIAHRANCTEDIMYERYAESYRHLTAVTDELAQAFLPERRR